MHDTNDRVTDITGQHCLEGTKDFGQCTACGVTVWRRHTPHHEQGPRTWLKWLALDGRDWNSFPEADTWVTHPDGSAPSCPPQGVEALCPWEENAHRYGGVWGDVQLATAMKTWCKTHQGVISDCPEPGPYCPGTQAHEDGQEGQPGPCTGRENTCSCMCPPCCGDTPDVWGYEGNY